MGLRVKGVYRALEGLLSVLQVQFLLFHISTMNLQGVGSEHFMRLIVFGLWRADKS